ncbi:unnamed protein product [Nippostrongylus brasiliensis]|uniref:WD repeat domain phosphoinositide-interacting protein 3 n=1 Tax=Nippostrongylus brasiliensis TaxID=27835 RepID=A0A0N4YR86_NIPBR|nr:unnamed protein product [Nippostrongylus brasiliensis]
MVWDDKLQELVLEVTVAGGPILNVFLSYSKLIVFQDRRIHVFQFPSPCKLIRTVEIRYNPTGLAAIGFTQLALNNQTTLLATGSTQGTVIRIFDANAPSSRLLMEFRRGADPCNLHCLQFSACSSFLAVSSDKGTIHIFAVRDSDETKKGLLHKVGLSKGEMRSVAQISLEPRVLACGFIKGTSSTMQSIVAICQDGSYHRFSFGADGSTKREGFDYVMQLGDEQEFWTKPF